MGLRLEATINGDKQMSVELGVVGVKIKDWRAPLTASAGELMKSFQLNFEAHGELFGGWAPRRKEQPWPILEKTGTLRGSFYSEITENEAVLGNKTSYFPYHQLGTSKLPKRVLLMMDAARRNFVVKAFQAHVIESIRGMK